MTPHMILLQSSVSMTPFTIDLDMNGPMVKAPTISKNAPKMQAWAKVNAWQPAHVPTELQMSFAAFAHAVMNAAMSPITNATTMLEALITTRTMSKVATAKTTNRIDQNCIFLRWK